MARRDLTRPILPLRAQIAATGGIASPTFDASKSSSPCPFPVGASRFDRRRQGRRRGGGRAGLHA